LRYSDAMEKSLINLTISSKYELDQIIQQYENGGRALSMIADYAMVLRNANKHGYEEYLAQVQKLMLENAQYSSEPQPTIDQETISIECD